VLAWSRFRVALPTWDRTLPMLLGCQDATLRRLGGAPTYALTDNEKTVTVERIARVPIRHTDVIAAGRYYGMTIRTCVPADPQSKGGAEATVRWWCLVRPTIRSGATARGDPPRPASVGDAPACVSQRVTPGTQFRPQATP
jgi:hypothetical protein